MGRRGADALGLHSLNIGNGNLRGQKWIFAEVLVVTAVHGRAIYVDAGAKQKGRAARTGISADLGADALGQFAIPCGCQGDAGGEGCRRRGIMGADRPITHGKVGTPNRGSGDDPRTLAPESRDIFSSRLNAGDGSVDPLFNPGRLDLSCLRRSRARQYDAQKK